MRIIARSALTRYLDALIGHKDNRAVKAALDSWFYEVKRARWKNPSDVKASYANASLIGADRIVFNVKGNAYRLVVAVDYRRAIVFIKWMGTHKEYDAIDVRSVQYAGKTDQDGQ